MPGKSVPLSVRVSEADATFLAALSLPEATTPSDKIRALIREARRRRQGRHEYTESLAFQQELFAPFLNGLREAEAAAGKHSELLVHLANWMPEAIAFLVANLPEKDSEDVDPALDRLESGAADRVFALMDQVLRLGVTSRNPCYDTRAISARVGPISELSEMALSATETRAGARRNRKGEGS